MRKNSAILSLFCCVAVVACLRVGVPTTGTQEIKLSKAIVTETSATDRPNGGPNKCETPCILGITPGETTWLEALELLRPGLISIPEPWAIVNGRPGEVGYSGNVRGLGGFQELEITVLTLNGIVVELLLTPVFELDAGNVLREMPIESEMFIRTYSVPKDGLLPMFVDIYSARRRTFVSLGIRAKLEGENVVGCSDLHPASGSVRVWATTETLFAWKRIVNEEWNTEPSASGLVKPAIDASKTTVENVLDVAQGKSKIFCITTKADRWPSP